MKHAALSIGAAIFAIAAASVDAHEPARGTTQGGVHLPETITPLFKSDMPNVPGKALLAVEVSFPPGAASPSHTHPKSAFIYAYVLSGEIVSAVDDEKPRVYRVGESWHEPPGARHPVTRNASKTEPARLLVIFVADPGEKQLVFPDPK
ncbi:MAG TPA: cupin domain-containing protein [Steroidobacter sp.]|uniref:cupin domain-containing protein n=1 Tax=Steroidobacter sp. TaxID=1978227 RepID=UPI002EDAD5AE